MKNLFQDNKEILFLHQKTAPKREGRYSVILSPQFYWVKKVQLPVKSVSQAKKLAESVFEGNLPVGKYSYEVTKADGEFVIIAYDKEYLLEALESYFIDDAKVDALYFSQYEFGDLNACCAIDNDNSLVNMNSILMQIPRACTDPKITVKNLIENRKLSRRKIKLSSFEEEVIDKKSFIFLAAAAALLFSSFLLEFFGYKNEMAKIEAQKSALIAKYDLPPTTMQLKSIKNSLFKVYKKQKKLRDELFLFSRLSLQKGEYIKNIELNEKGATVEIKLKNPQRKERIKSFISRNFKIVQSDFKDNILRLKIAS